MSVLLIVLIGVALWCVVPIPVAVVVGRAFRTADFADIEDSFAEIVRTYGAAGA